jgi:predicted permease
MPIISSAVATTALPCLIFSLISETVLDIAALLALGFDM